MTQPTRAHLVSLAWQRFQVIVRLAPEPGTQIAPGRLRLRHAGHPTERSAPVRAWHEGDTVIARFNVMLGPDQMPLREGRWDLVAERDDGEITEIRASADPTAIRDGVAAFLLWNGTYRVTSGIDPASGIMSLEVRLDRTSAAPKETALPLRLARRLWRAFRVLVLRFVLAALRLFVRRTGQRILFMSDYASELTGNLRLVRDRMVERGLDREYELLTLTRSRLYGGRGLRGRLVLPWLLARADTIVIDKDQPVLHRLPAPGQRIIQLWHSSGAIKTVGYSRIGRPHGPNPWSRTHKDYTYAIVSGEHDVPLYAEAFGIPEDRVVPTGIPRMDRFFDAAARAEGREASLAALPAARGRMVILFAPTFRGLLREATYDLEVLDYARIHALCLEKDAVFVIRLHPHVDRPLDIPPQFADRLLDGSSSVMDSPDLLFATDLLITDYSSIVFEYSTLGRPMLFFAYDLEEYKAARDVYVPYEEFVPGKIVGTFDALVEAIRRDDYEVEKVAPFAARHFSHPEGGATDRVIELILGR